MNNREKELVNEITNQMNICGFSTNEFCDAMSHEHRYLQNEFTNLCIHWLETASKQYNDGNYDGRNEFGCKIANILINRFYNL